MDRMLKLSILLLPLVLQTACSNNPGSENWSYTGMQGVRSEIIREPLSPVRIVWLSDDTGDLIKNAGALLEEGVGQADLVGKNLCTMVGGKDHNPAILLDFGREIHGGLEIVTGMFRNHDPIKVRITLGESVSEAMSRVESSTATNDHAMRDFELSLPWLGKIEVGNSGFRFVKIELLDADRVLLLKEVRALQVYRDIPYLGSFRSNDERLNEIWMTGAYTVHLNMQEYLWDGIKRDQLVWVGDMHPEVMTILSVFGYNEVVPKSLDMIREITPLPQWMNGISSYSMWWILVHHQWYMNTGDLGYLQKHREYMFGLLEVLKSKIDENGKEGLDGTRFLDWPTSPNSLAVHAGLQAMMVKTFKAGADIAGIFGDNERRDDCLDVVALLKQHVPSPNGNKSAGALMALAGLADTRAMNDTLLSVESHSGISTFYGYYVLNARAEAGDYTGAMDLIRDYWGAMLDLGATTFWEDFDLAWMENAGRIDELTPEGKIDVHATYGEYCYVGLRHSLCHGWASGPTAWMTRYVLGIQVVEPGCKTVLIDPNLGDLEWAEGTFPTPYGLISVRHEKDSNGKVSSNVDAPRGVKIVFADGVRGI